MSRKKLRKKRNPSGPSSRHSTPVFSAVSKCSEAIGRGTVRADATSLAVTAGPKPSSAATSCPILAHTCMCQLKQLRLLTWSAELQSSNVQHNTGCAYAYIMLRAASCVFALQDGKKLCMSANTSVLRTPASMMEPNMQSMQHHGLCHRCSPFPACISDE